MQIPLLSLLSRRWLEGEREVNKSVSEDFEITFLKLLFLSQVPEIMLGEYL